MEKIKDLLKKAQSLQPDESSINNAKRTFLAEIEAVDFFDKVRQKLFRIEEWDENGGISTYALFDENGNELDRNKPIAVNDFIAITIPGSGKSDWVKVIEITDAPTEFVITVQPTYDPTEKPSDKSVISHFFTAEATNNFCLQRDAKTVTIYVIGINEKTNTKHTDGLIETARNLAAANLGYYLGAQKAMWKTFCRNFLEIGESEKEEK